MSTRRTRRSAAVTEVTEEVAVETRSKRTRAASKKTVSSKTTKVAKDSTASSRSSASAQPVTRSDSDAVASTPAPVTTPAPATNKRRLRSTTEAASPLRALDEQPAKKQRTSIRKAPTPAPAPVRPAPVQEEDDDDDEEEVPYFWSTKFDSFDVEQPEPTKPSFLIGDESAMALLRHVQEAAKPPAPASPTSTHAATSPVRSPTPPAAEAQHTSPPAPAHNENPSTPSRGLFGSFTSPFTAIRNLFGAATPAAPSPTPSRRPPPNTMTEVLTMPPTPVGERPKRPSKKKKQSRMVKALLKGIDQQELSKATAWAKKIAAELKNDPTASEKRKRLELPVLFRDLEHFPASKPWESGFSFPEDILDLDDDEVVPAWAVYASMMEEEREIKKAKTVHVPSGDDDMPASINEVFGGTASIQDFHPRRAIDPSPMFNHTVYHNDGTNIFAEQCGNSATANDYEKTQRELKAAVEKPTPRAHDPVHGSFSVPDSDSESEGEEVHAQPVWTQAPPPPPTPAHVPLPASNHNEEVERQRQKLMKHTPHKPSRLQQVSYPSPSALSDAGESPLKAADIFGEIPQPELITFDDDPELAAAWAVARAAGGVEFYLEQMKHWEAPIVTYDSDEEEISPI